MLLRGEQLAPIVVSEPVRVIATVIVAALGNGNDTVTVLDADLRELFSRRMISLNEALSRANDPEEFKRLANVV